MLCEFFLLFGPEPKGDEEVVLLFFLFSISLIIDSVRVEILCGASSISPPDEIRVFTFQTAQLKHIKVSAALIPSSEGGKAKRNFNA